MCQWARNEIVVLFVVEEGQHIMAGAGEIGAVQEPPCVLWERRIKRILLNSVTENTRDRLNNDFPPSLEWSAVQVPNWPLVYCSRIVEVFDP